MLGVANLAIILIAKGKLPVPTRQLFLRIMLWSLPLAAVGGVLAVFTQSRSLAERVVWTGITTAIACALLMPVGTLVDRRETRSTGLFGMSAVLTEFFLAILLLWDVPQLLVWARLEEEIALTMILVFVVFVFGFCSLLLSGRSYGLWAGRIGVVFSLASFVAWMISVWIPSNSSYGPVRDEWMETGFALLVWGVLAGLCLIGTRSERPRRWRYVGIAAGTVSCCMWLIDIWVGAGSELGYIVFYGLLSLATILAHANICVRAAMAPDHVWVRTCTLVAAAFTAIMIELSVIFEGRAAMVGYIGMIERCAAAGGIVAGCGTLAIVVFARFDRRVDYQPATTDLSCISIVCPRCNKKQQIGVGKSVCVSCQLRISIRLEEPRCPTCEYLLFGLTSDRCPECGTPIAQDSSPSTAS